MLKRTIIFGTVIAVFVAMGPLSAFAQGEKAPTTKPVMTAPKAAGEKTARTHTAAAQAPAANEIAVCGCGKVFVPDSKTQYVEFGGKKYACCSDGCHKMALADPASAAKMADDNMAKAMSQLSPPKPN